MKASGLTTLRVRSATQRGEHRAGHESRALPPQHRGGEPREEHRQPGHEGERVEAVLGQAVVGAIEQHPVVGAGEQEGEQDDDGRRQPPELANLRGLVTGEQPVRGQQQGKRERRHGDQLEEAGPGVLRDGRPRQRLELARAEEEFPRLETDEQREQHADGAQEGEYGGRGDPRVELERGRREPALAPEPAAQQAGRRPRHESGQEEVRREPPPDRSPGCSPWSGRRADPPRLSSEPNRRSTGTAARSPTATAVSRRVRAVSGSSAQRTSATAAGIGPPATDTPIQSTAPDQVGNAEAVQRLHRGGRGGHDEQADDRQDVECEERGRIPPEHAGEDERHRAGQPRRTRWRRERAAADQRQDGKEHRHSPERDVEPRRGPDPEHVPDDAERRRRPEERERVSSAAVHVGESPSPRVVFPAARLLAGPSSRASGSPR